MADNNLGMWLSSFQQGLDASKPTNFPGDGNIAFYFATDTATLYVAVKPAANASQTASWKAMLGVNTADVSYDATKKTLVLANIPTADPGVAGALYSNSGVVTVSAGT